MHNQFLLDENVVYLNHGSYGACPKSVFEEYQSWQNQFELQPVDFVENQLPGLLAKSRTTLSEFLNVNANDMVLIPNPTTAMNEIVRSLDLSPGDEILTTNHEYGAIENTWKFITKKTGAIYKPVNIPLPIISKDNIVEIITSNITDRTKVIFLSHITSPTALIFPVKQICDFARKKGIISIIDGAHAPGQIALDISVIDPDIYIGTCHKWLCAPKGSSFMYVKKALQESIDPLVVGWGWRDESSELTQFINNHEWWGTQDLSAYLSIPKAVELSNSTEWNNTISHNRELLLKIRDRINRITGESLICPDEMIGKMAAVILPHIDPFKFKTSLIEEYKIEIPVYKWCNYNILRVSMQVYNHQRDLDCLASALNKLLDNT